MKSTNQPQRVPQPFADDGVRNAIPEEPVDSKPGAASLRDGFPSKTMTSPAQGGVPPSGRDMNGILHLLSSAVRWAQLGGLYAYSAEFAINPNVGGYPKGAVLLSADSSRLWMNLADGNVTDPDATDGSAADWAPMAPDWNATSGPGKILNRPSLAKVATSGKHSDLTGVKGNGELHISEEERQRLNTPVLLSETIYSVVVQSVTFFMAGWSRITCSLVPPLIGSPVVFSSAGVLPPEISASVTYYVVGASPIIEADSGVGGWFEVSAMPGGPAIVMSTTGSGTHSITNPKWLKSTHNPIWIEAEVQGAGAGGGTAGGGTGTATGGGGGGYARLRRLASSLPDSLDIVVGAGGQPGPTEGSLGSHGGTTSLGSVVSATGGRGGVGSATNMLILGSTPGDAVGGDWNIRGEGSEPVQFTTFSNYSRGGSSMFGFGGMGSIRISGATPLPHGTGRGAGGAGGLGPTSAFAAGRGSDGLVILREYA
ncbi:hypothetical protein [Cupriavidus necator]|uniref:glycine-rich domain-containing protein n=1 Tax=Cupriavidus necator TaxID=106590 RepID=UPI000B0DC350|nr:hypothetical protein [Cupriavidus necator]